MPHESWDLVLRWLSILVPVVMTIIFGLLALAMRVTIGRLMDKIVSVQAVLTETIGRVADKLANVQGELTEHKDACSKVDTAVLANQVETLDKEMTNARKFARWVGDCIGRIAGKLDVVLPDRPD